MKTTLSVTHQQYQLIKSGIGNNIGTQFEELLPKQPQNGLYQIVVSHRFEHELFYLGILVALEIKTMANAAG